MGDSTEKNVNPLLHHTSDAMGPTGATSLLETSNQEEGDGGQACFDDSGLSTQLQSGLECLRMERSLTDVRLQVDGQEFPCHRVVLAAASHYFRAMFCNDLREKNEDRIHIKGVDAETMALLLDYTYTSKVLITKQNVQKVLEAASLFQVTDEHVLYVDTSACSSLHTAVSELELGDHYEYQ